MSAIHRDPKDLEYGFSNLSGRISEVTGHEAMVY